MSGEQDLNVLLRSMQPEMQDGVYVFCTVPYGEPVADDLRPLALFREKEGVTLIVRHEAAEQANLKYQCPSRMITLTIHSSLDAVGFMAAITMRLAQAGISVNPVSAFYHDHLFIPVACADKAMQILTAFAVE